ncbi:MAG: putative porin, partial [Bacteroidota bacterium]
DKVPIEVGINAHARSRYFANAYAPEIQQFYLQNDLPIEAYYMADLFFNMKLDKFFMGIKFTHIDQPSDDGYFATPFYPGQPRTFDLIFRWLFFD